MKPQPQTSMDVDISEGYGDMITETQESADVFIHVSARETTRLVIMSERPLRYAGHWIQRGFKPCYGPTTCNWCAIGMGKKPRYAYCVYDPVRHKTGVFEVGPEVAFQIRDECDRVEHTVGVCLTFAKRGKVINGAIMCTGFHSFYPVRELPPTLDLEKIYRGMWQQPEALK